MDSDSVIGGIMTYIFYVFFIICIIMCMAGGILICFVHLFYGFMQECGGYCCNIYDRLRGRRRSFLDYEEIIIDENLDDYQN